MSFFGPLVTPDQVEDELLAVLRTSIRQQHLAELERVKGLGPRTIPDFKTVGRLGAEDQRAAEDHPPALLLAVIGTAEIPELDADRQLDFAWTVAVEMAVTGVSRVDAMRAVRWYATSVAQLLMQRAPRNGVVQSLRLRDVEFLDAGRRVASARLLFVARCGAVLAMDAGPGPGSEPDDPYAPPDAWPSVPVPVTGTVIDVEKEPLS